MLDHIDEKTIREVLPKAQVLLKANDSPQLQHIVLRLVDKLVANLERGEILDEILPLLVNSKLSDPIVLRPTLRKSLIRLSFEIMADGLSEMASGRPSPSSEFAASCYKASLE